MQVLGQVKRQSPPAIYRLIAIDKTDMTYSPGEVTEFLEIASSTLRHYARTFAAHLSPSAQGRRRKYTDQDLETLAQIKSLSADGKTLDQIREILGETVIVDDTGEDQQPDRRLALVPAIIDELKDLQNRDQITNDKLDAILERLDRMENKPSFWDRLFRRSE